MARRTILENVRIFARKHTPTFAPMMGMRPLKDKRVKPTAGVKRAMLEKLLDMGFTQQQAAHIVADNKTFGEIVDLAIETTKNLPKV